MVPPSAPLSTEVEPQLGHAEAAEEVEPQLGRAEASEDVGPDLRDLFRKKGALSLARLRKRLREESLRELGQADLEALAAEIAARKMLPKLCTILLDVVDHPSPGQFERQVSDLAAAVAAQLGKWTAGEAAQPQVELPVDSDGVRELVKGAVEDKKGRAKHDLTVLILLVFRHRNRISRDDMLGLTETLLGPRRPKRSAVMPEVAVRDALLAHLVKPADLKVALQMRGAYEQLVDDLRDGQDSLRTSRVEIAARLESREAELTEREREIHTLQGRVRELQDEIGGLQRDAVSQETTSTYELQSTRARLLGVLSGELTRWLETAQEAVTMEPARIRVVTERLEQSLRTIRAEAAWLRSLA